MYDDRRNVRFVSFMTLAVVPGEEAEETMVNILEHSPDNYNEDRTLLADRLDLLQDKAGKPAPGWKQEVGLRNAHKQ